MDIAAALQSAQILRVAIVDDDLSKSISIEDLRSIDNDVAALLGDRHDPDRIAYITALRALNYDIESLGDLAEPLSISTVRDAAPARLREAATQILEKRIDNAEPVRRVQALLESLGVKTKNIDHYTAPNIPHNEIYDLLIIDYFLVDNSQDRTIPFIAEVLESHKGAANPLQIILMSTHEQELRQVFRTLRPRLEVSSSRMRIMEKPETDDHLIQWKLLLNQLAIDRSYVGAIENFVRRASEVTKRAADEQTKKLWELDLQAMDLLHEIAIDDNDDFCRYIEDCLSRHLLTGLEALPEMRESLTTLGGMLTQHRSGNVLAPSAEISDSRAAISSLMTSMAWRGSNAILPSAFPGSGTPLEKANWITNNIRFGMVIRAPDNSIWLNITQACDLAQAEEADFNTTCILLIRGSHTSLWSASKKTSIIQMSAKMSEAETDVISWNLLSTRVPTIQEFGADFGNGWTVIGELRLDQAQNIAGTYSARSARVGLAKPLKTWKLQGIAMKATTLRNAGYDDEVVGTAVTGHAQKRVKFEEQHIDLDSLNTLLTTYPGALDDSSLQIYNGLQMRPGSKVEIKPLLHYCANRPANMGELRFSLKHDNWLRRDDNAEKLILAFWYI